MYPRLTDLDVLQTYLAREKIEPARSSGQNFLVSQEVVEATVECLKGQPKHVTELGAGAGVLTQALVASGFTVKAIERDKKLIRVLQAALPAKKRSEVKVVEADLKEVDWAWDEPYVLAGNIPYNLSGFIFRKTTQLLPAPALVVFLVQLEVAQRVVAAPPNMSLLGLAVQLWGKPLIVLFVPPDSFWPKPQVTSALIAVEPHGTLPALDERERILAVAKKFFQGKRKQMGGQMKRLFNLSPEDILAVCDQAGIQPSMRPQEVGVEQWKELSIALVL